MIHHATPPARNLLLLRSRASSSTTQSLAAIRLADCPVRPHSSSARLTIVLTVRYTRVNSRPRKQCRTPPPRPTTDRPRRCCSYRIVASVLVLVSSSCPVLLFPLHRQSRSNSPCKSGLASPLPSAARCSPALLFPVSTNVRPPAEPTRRGPGAHDTPCTSRAGPL
jgi:hypothetical protein